MPDDIGFDFDLDFKIDIPSEEERQAARQKVYDWTHENLLPIDGIDAAVAARDETSAPARFNLLSLPAWNAIAAAAGISHIPARLVAEIDAADYLRAFDEPDTAAYAAFHAAVVAGIAPGELVRMEQVAPREIKGLLSDGQPVSDGLVELIDGSRYLDLHEDRFYTTFGDLGADRVRAYARPIITPMAVAGAHEGLRGYWPVEFRVFVEDGHIVGISNYYPQVALNPRQHGLYAAEALVAARIILATMDRLRLGVGNHALCSDYGPMDCMTARADWMPVGWAAQDFTLDFIVDTTGLVHFLEAGPAGMRAAHPCCFLQEGRAREPDFLHGVAWSSQSAIEPLSSLEDPDVFG